MAGTAAPRKDEENRARAMEDNNYNSGKSGSKVAMHHGPASKGGVAKTNATMSGGINRSTRGSSGQPHGS